MSSSVDCEAVLGSMLAEHPPTSAGARAATVRALEQCETAAASLLAPPDGTCHAAYDASAEPSQVPAPHLVLFGASSSTDVAFGGLGALGVHSSRFHTLCPTSAVARGRWMFEVTLGSRGVLQVGWAPPPDLVPYCASFGAGDFVGSVAYDGGRQCVWQDGVQASCDGQRWIEGDVVGACCDLELGVAAFTLNGVERWRGPITTLRGLEAVPCAAGDEAAAVFVPAVSATKHEDYELNLGQAPFRHPVDGFRPVSWGMQAPVPPMTLTPRGMSLPHSVRARLLVAVASTVPLPRRTAAAAALLHDALSDPSSMPLTRLAAATALALIDEAQRLPESAWQARLAAVIALMEALLAPNAAHDFVLQLVSVVGNSMVIDLTASPHPVTGTFPFLAAAGIFTALLERHPHCSHAWLALQPDAGYPGLMGLWHPVTGATTAWNGSLSLVSAEVPPEVRAAVDRTAGFIDVVDRARIKVVRALAVHFPAALEGFVKELATFAGRHWNHPHPARSIAASVFISIAAAAASFVDAAASDASVAAQFAGGAWLSGGVQDLQRVGGDLRTLRRRRPLAVGAEPDMEDPGALLLWWGAWLFQKTSLPQLQHLERLSDAAVIARTRALAVGSEVRDGAETVLTLLLGRCYLSGAVGARLLDYATLIARVVKHYGLPTPDGARGPEFSYLPTAFLWAVTELVAVAKRLSPSTFSSVLEARPALAAALVPNVLAADVEAEAATEAVLDGALRVLAPPLPVTTAHAATLATLLQENPTVGPHVVTRTLGHLSHDYAWSISVALLGGFGAGNGLFAPPPASFLSARWLAPEAFAGPAHGRVPGRGMFAVMAPALREAMSGAAPALDAGVTLRTLIRRVNWLTGEFSASVTSDLTNGTAERRLVDIASLLTELLRGLEFVVEASADVLFGPGAAGDPAATAHVICECLFQTLTRVVGQAAAFDAAIKASKYNFPWHSQHLVAPLLGTLLVLVPAVTPQPWAADIAAALRSHRLEWTPAQVFGAAADYDWDGLLSSGAVTAPAAKADLFFSDAWRTALTDIHAQRQRRDSAALDDDEDLCVICQLDPADCVFSPCGHHSCRTCITRRMEDCRQCFFCKEDIAALSDRAAPPPGPQP